MARTWAPEWQSGMQPLGDAVKQISNVGYFAAYLIPMAVGVAAIVFAAGKEESKHIWVIWAGPPLILIATAISAIPTGKPLDNLLTTRSAEQIPVDRFNRVAFANEDWGIIAAAKSPVMPPNLAALFRVHDPAGYDSLLNKDTKAILDEANDADSAPPANGNIMFVKSTAAPERLAELGVREIWSRKPLDAFGEPLTQENGYLRYRVPGPGRLSIEGGQSKVLGELPNAIYVQAQGPGRLVLRDRSLPGWKATLDGEPAELKGTRWLEVDLPEGDHYIDFSYSAPGFSTGLVLGIPALLLALAGLLRGNRSGRTDPPTPEPEMQ